MLVKIIDNKAYTDIDWEKANCREYPRDIFFDVEERYGEKKIDLQILRSICASCPIWEKCLKYASDNEDFGVWGGMTSNERLAMVSSKTSSLKLKTIKDFKKQGISAATLSKVMRNK